MDLTVIDFSTIVIPIVIGFIFVLFGTEISELCKKIRNKPFESFVIVGLCAVIVILYKGFF